ncbi:alpha/beta fold hydrolase [Streptomyces sp. NPDC050485]|uniref:alpha/beta fold hydrolase n=1 Tax=Streptomyces sp. NPDC050485 TaxID=3365617 RepID=UPI0037980315
MLYVRTWGDAGRRRVLLVHGLTSDSTTWSELGRDLARRGYQVDAIDLPGHGHSPRWPGYSVESVTSALIDWVGTRRYELAVGHSLGGLIIAAAVTRLPIGGVVYLDPAWRAAQPGWSEMFRRRKNQTDEDIAAANPHWTAAQVAAKFAMLQRWDPETVQITDRFAGWPVTPPVRPSLVLRADPSMTITDEHTTALREVGYTVDTVRNAGHVIHLDNYPGMLAALDRWIPTTHEPPAHPNHPSNTTS